MFSLKKIWLTNPKNLGSVSTALPSHRLALAETKSPSNQRKMKKKRCAGKPSDASLRENTAKEGEEEG